MAKKQTRRSISVSRTTYERLKAFCEANNISMSQFVETRVGDFLTTDTPAPAPRPIPTMATTPPRERPVSLSIPAPKVAVHETTRHEPRHEPRAERLPTPAAPVAAVASNATVPMTSAAARYAVEPPPPIIKPKQETAAPKPAEKRPDQIFTF